MEFLFGMVIGFGLMYLVHKNNEENTGITVYTRSTDKKFIDDLAAYIIAMIDNNNWASLSDFNAFSDGDITAFYEKDARYGWDRDDISKIKVEEVNDEWVVTMPPAHVRVEN